MAKITPKVAPEDLKRFFTIADKITAKQSVSDDDLRFFSSYAPDIDKKAMEEFVNSDPDLRGTTPEQKEAALVDALRIMQTSPEYKEQAIRMAQETDKSNFTEKLSKGLELILGATDVANSIKQISESKKALDKSKKPSRPSIPARDSYLQQALRQAQDVSQGVQTAIAPVEAQIQDQYQADLANAKTASTGQAGAYGSYAQLAANRRDRAAMELAPIADQIRSRNQARLDDLVAQRRDETQQQFQNQASLYPYDLHQYGQEQAAAAELGSTGRQNLRNSLYNAAGQIAPTVADLYTERKYRDLQNKATAVMGEDLATKYALPAQQQMDEMYGVNYKPKLTPYQLYRQSLIS